jgi:hypothetical protein
MPEPVNLCVVPIIHVARKILTIIPVENPYRKDVFGFSLLIERKKGIRENQESQKIK